jgi:GntR family transcriptional repressor for pyruvate dehydrogenase complex
MTMTHTTTVRRNDFRPVARATLSAQIRDQLLRRILDGQLEPGARVPSERDLSERFGVARTSVREAMQGLLSLGVIERKGNRVFVVEHLPDVNFDRLDDRKEVVRQLFETRRLLEVPIIGLAAERATDEQRAEIRELAERFSADMDLPLFRQLDHAFHSLIARACANPLLVEVYGKVIARLCRSEDIEALLSSDANQVEVRRIVGQAAEQHAALASAVAAGDSAAAVAEGTAHLASVERGMIDRLA